jgi:hypothetical protein
MEKLPGTEIAAEIAALKALVVALIEKISLSQEDATVRAELLNSALGNLKRSNTWNAPSDPTEELRQRACQRCMEIVDTAFS